MNDWDKIQKLLNIANSTHNKFEAESCLKKAEKIINNNNLISNSNFNKKILYLDSDQSIIKKHLQSQSAPHIFPNNHINIKYRKYLADIITLAIILFSYYMI